MLTLPMLILDACLFVEMMELEKILALLNVLTIWRIKLVPMVKIECLGLEKFMIDLLI